MYLDNEKLIEKVGGGLHVFLLGAGASLAAFPNGDANGRKLPLMNNLAATIEVEFDLEQVGYRKPHDDFEAIFSDLSTRDDCYEIVEVIEDKIERYFSALTLPDQPTIYDYLVLFLRDKDFIATFNWDPLLMQAVQRNEHVAPPPHICSLHGNVGIGYCDNHDNIVFGHLGWLCGRCRKPFKATKLLYPIHKKGYSQDPFISSSWLDTQTALREAFLFTIFGYSAPTSDTEAVELLKTGWGDKEKRKLEEVEIIDILDEDTLLSRWDSFILSHHYQVASSFFDSLVYRYPRRSCSAMFSMLLECDGCDPFKVPTFSKLDDLHNWIQPFLEAENM